MKESYDIWRIRRRHQRNLEQIEIDELDEVASYENVDDGAKAWTEIHTRHEQRRIAPVQVEEGSEKLGLDPSKVEYLALSHAHGDHDGGARFL